MPEEINPTTKITLSVEQYEKDIKLWLKVHHEHGIQLTILNEKGGVSMIIGRNPESKLPQIDDEWLKELLDGNPPDDPDAPCDSNWLK